MSRRSYIKHHQGGHAGQSGHNRQQYAVAGGGYTLAHAGRQLRLGPIAFWVAVGTLVIMAAWAIITATYFAFREDVLTRLITREAEMQLSYEDRIAALRAQVDRVSSRQLLDQEQHERKLDHVLRRQAALESTAGALSGLGDITGSIRQPTRSGAEPRTAPLKPAPIGDKGAFAVPSKREAPFGPRGSHFAKGTGAVDAGGMSGVLARVQASLDRVEQRQIAALNSIEESYESKARRIRGVLVELGVDMSKAASGDSASGVGGPFVPARLPKEAIGFERQLHRIAIARAQVARLTRAVGSVPLRNPVDSNVDPSSGYGVRADPFTGSPAMHTGLDLHGETGDPVRAAANGVVTAAGWSGGYGKVVDVDHGNGVSTRYGHMSAIEVNVGQAVRTGQLLGRIGTTGRSTGPHLHYETRVGGKPVDPQKFLRAAQRLHL